MKIRSIVLMASGALLLSGCVVYDTPHRDGARQRMPNRADHDRDGVPDRHDSRPNDPRRN